MEYLDAMWKERDRIVQQPIASALRTVALPAVGSSLFYVVFEIVDMFWVGKLGAVPVAALSAASFFVWMLRALAQTVATGVIAFVSRRVGEKRVALVALAVSGVLCASSWWLFEQHAIAVAGAALVWGMFVIADSPQFSALAARHCPPQYTGTALTVQNGIGFGITVISIQLTAGWGQYWGWKWAFPILVIGPILGIWALTRLRSGSGAKNI